MLSEEEIKTENTQEKRHKEKKKKRSRQQIKVRLIPIWLRVLVIMIAIVISLLAGIVVGYSVIGDGNPQDALKKSTWTHIIDFVNKER